jgi:hypothetical protein
MNVDYISIGRNPPEEVNAIIEVPIGGEPIKYEMDKKAGTLVVDRFFYTVAPADYASCRHDIISLWHCIPSRFRTPARIKPGTPNIQPSTCATVRSGRVRLGFRNAARLPSRSARESQAAMEYASCWSGVRASGAKEAALKAAGAETIYRGRWATRSGTRRRPKAG